MTSSSTPTSIIESQKGDMSRATKTIPGDCCARRDRERAMFPSFLSIWQDHADTRPICGEVQILRGRASRGSYDTLAPAYNVLCEGLSLHVGWC